VLHLLLSGLENKQIGHVMGISEPAVKEHVSDLLRKFAVNNRAELAYRVGTPLVVTGALDVDASWLEQLFRDSAAQICIFRGPELRFAAANRAFRRATGHRPLLGRTMRDAFPELEGRGEFERMERVYATGDTDVLHEHTRYWQGDDGLKCVILDVILQPLRGDDGRVNGVLSIAVDVTELLSRRASNESAAQ